MPKINTRDVMQYARVGAGVNEISQRKETDNTKSEHLCNNAASKKYNMNISKMSNDTLGSDTVHTTALT